MYTLRCVVRPHSVQLDLAVSSSGRAPPDPPQSRDQKASTTSQAVQWRLIAEQSFTSGSLHEIIPFYIFTPEPNAVKHYTPVLRHSHSTLSYTQLYCTGEESFHPGNLSLGTRLIAEQDTRRCIAIVSVPILPRRLHFSCFLRPDETTPEYIFNADVHRAYPLHTDSRHAGFFS